MDYKKNKLETTKIVPTARKIWMAETWIGCRDLIFGQIDNVMLEQRWTTKLVGLVWEFSFLFYTAEMDTYLKEMYSKGWISYVQWNS